MSMHIFFRWALGFLMTVTLGGPIQAVAFEIEKSEGSTLYFKAEEGVKTRSLNTGLFEMKFLGHLNSKDTKATRLIVSGRPCQECLQEKAIYLFKPEGTKPDHIVYPGKIVDPKHNQVVFESRSFFGRCLPQTNDVLVTFQRERVDRRHGLQPSVLIIEPGPDHLQEKLIEKRLPKISFTLSRVKEKQCHEIEGRNRLILNKPLDLTPRHGTSDNDDDDEEANEDEKGPDRKAPGGDPATPATLTGAT